MFASSTQIVEQLEGKIREINHQMQEAREDVKLYELEQLEASHKPPCGSPGVAPGAQDWGS